MKTICTVSFDLLLSDLHPSMPWMHARKLMSDACGRAGLGEWLGAGSDGMRFDFAYIIRGNGDDAEYEATRKVGLTLGQQFPMRVLSMDIEFTTINGRHITPPVQMWRGQQVVWRKARI